MAVVDPILLFHVNGTIYDEHDMPLPNVLVKVLDKDLRTEQMLSEVLTDSKGTYAITFRLEAALDPEYKTADVFLRIFDLQGQQLGQSPVYFNVGEKTTIDYKIGNTAYKGTNEFDALVALIEPIIKPSQVDIAGLKEDEEFKDISFLAGETGEDINHITFLAEAFKLADKADKFLAANDSTDGIDQPARFNISPAFFFALLRLEFSSDLIVLLKAPTEKWRNSFAEAIEKNIISGKLALSIEPTIATFHKLRAITLVEDEEISSVIFKNTFGPALPDPKLQKIFLEEYYTYKSKPEQFWSNLAQRPEFADGKAIKAIKSILLLSTLTGNQGALTTLLYTEQQQDETLNDLRGFARFTKADWKDRITRLVASGELKDFPQGITGATTEEKTDRYAASLLSLIHMLYPTDVFAQRVKASTEIHWESVKADMLVFFGNNNTFDLKTNNIHKLFKTANFEAVNNRKAVQDELGAINRLYKLSDDATHISALRKEGIGASSQIINKYSKQLFVANFTPVFGSAQEAGNMYNKARQIDRMSTAVAVNYQITLGLSTYVMNVDTLNVEDTEHEDYKALLASSLCDCEHCQSVYSPAVYLVDILKCIRDDGNNDGQETEGGEQAIQAYDLLISRRPDLVHINLTCKNTNTPVPYIDLVNELLEKEVIKLSENAEEIAALESSCQTEAEAEEITAIPENINGQAYEELKQATGDTVLSPYLPFDLSLEEMRVYTDKLGYKRHKLITLFYGKIEPGIYKDVIIATELLQLTPGELRLLNGETPFDISLPPNIAELLGKTGFSYIELLQLLETNFLNPKNADGEGILSIVSTDNDNPATCVLQDLNLTGIDNLWVNKMIRFVRLWKKLGWNIFDLDRFFTAFDISTFDDFNENILLPVSHIVRIQDQLHLSVRQIITFWKNIDTNIYVDHSKEGQPLVSSRYQQLFRNKAVTNPLNPDFKDDYDNLEGTMIPHAETFSSALGITQTDLELLVTNVDELSLGNITKIYRHVVLSRALKMSITDLLNFISITGIQPFDIAGNTDATLLFIDEWKFLQTESLSVYALEQLINDRTDSAYSLPINEELVASINLHINALETIRTDDIPGETEAIREDKRKEKFIEELNLIIQLFTDNTNLVEALKDDINGEDDLIIKNVLDDYLNGEKSKSLQSLTIEGFVNKLRILIPLFEQYILLKSIPPVVKKSGFELSEIIWLKERRAIIGIDSLFILDAELGITAQYHAFKKLYYLSLLNKSKVDQSDKLTELLDIAVDNGEVTAKQNYIDRLVTMYNIDASFALFLLADSEDINNNGILNADFPSSFLDGKFLLKVLSCCNTIAALGGKSNHISALIIEEVTDTEAQTVKNILKSRYENTVWLSIIKPINDQLRVRRRDALVAFLLAKNPVQWPVSNAFFESLLIDVEMDVCMVTSRIKQAISSVQMFIQRCLIGLENTSLGDDFADLWREWKNRYRVWEANRKIFLYPENWIEPELRDGKSPFFEELESRLLQDEVTSETATYALNEYLEKLDMIARLEIVGIYEEKNGNERITHVFGRTKDVPHKYFYRKNFKSIWSPWEKVDLDIEGNHIIPVIFNKRLILFWAIFNEKQDNSQETEVPEPGGPLPGTSKYWEVKMAFSEYKHGKWEPKKLTKEKKFTWKIPIERFFIRLLPGNGIQFKFYQVNGNFLDRGQNFFDEPQFAAPPLAMARMINENGLPSHFENDLVFTEGETHYSDKYHCPPGTVFKNLKIVEDSQNKLGFYKNGIIDFRSTEDSASADLDILFQKTPGTFNIAFPSIENASVIDLFAYEDKTGVFLVRASFSPVVEPINESTIMMNIFWTNYQFQTFYYPYADDLIRIQNTMVTDGIYKKEIQNADHENLFSEAAYNPDSSIVNTPVKNYDFSVRGAYSIYNWELFFHIPMLIADRLSKNQKFEEAQKWYHYIFNPTTRSREKSAKRFWITKPFRKEIENKILSLSDLLDEDKNPDLQKQVDYWETNPFKPHAVARMRPSAYMLNVLKKYLDNLIAWGDYFFRNNTLETINEATMLYVQAANILGKKPEQIPSRAIPEIYSFDTLPEIDPFANVKAQIEGFILPSAAPDDNADSLVMPLFCIPKNDQMLSYWDTVADRLFKIRHCQNIEGTFQQLPLFEPPIDPALLVRATAVGLDLNSILYDMNAGLPNYRFQVILQQANELCNDVKALGNALLSALEKKDAEQLSLIRSGQELSIIQAMKDIKKKQKGEAVENLQSLNKSKEVVEFRKEYYLTRDFKNFYENQHLELLESAKGYQTLQSGAELIASILYSLPNYTAGAWAWGVHNGGITWGNAAKAGGAVFGYLANKEIVAGSKSSIIGNFQRRDDDWKFQGQSADLELKQLDKQIIAAEIRLAIAERDLEIHEQQIENAIEINDYMRSKFTNTELYDWMVGQLSTVYFQSYQLAYTTAKKAERCLQYELGKEGTNYVQFGYWDSLKKGLVSGEKLQYELRRLENAYLEQNTREYEIVKHVSLVMLDPVALIMLRETGSCEFEVPEVLYDMDHPGQYFRRLKSVSISLPCIAGPYTSVSAKLSLGANKYRKSTDITGGYEEIVGADETASTDERFIYNTNTVQSIATSSGQNDSGVFELNFRDERYLPFEGAGAVSTWNLELPTEIRQFDYNTIADVIVHVKYTSREGDDLKTVVNEKLKLQLQAIKQSLSETGLHIALNMKHDLTNEWHLLKKTGNADLTLDKSRFPYMIQSIETASIKSVMFFAKLNENSDSFILTTQSDSVTTETEFEKVGELELYKGINTAIRLNTSFKLSVAEVGKLEDLILVVKYRFNAE